LSLKSDELLKEGLRVLEIEPTPERTAAFSVYRQELQKWGRVHNLTSNLSDRSIVIRHFLDSLLYLKGFPEKSLLRVADVGSGAGFPGLPMAITRPTDRFVLFEPRKKRTDFLRHMRRLLGLKNLEIVGSRVEDSRTSEGTYDVIVTRALYSPIQLVSATKQLLNPGGRWILSAGPRYQAVDVGSDIKLEERRITVPIENVDRWLIILITSLVPRGTM